MYAVIKTGGKQYKVAENDLLRIEKIEAEAGSIVTLNEVLLVANDNDVTVGSPMIDGASVAVEVLSQRRARKIIVFKKRRRKSSRTKNGHRQHFTLVRISEILTKGAKPSKAPQGMPDKTTFQVVNDDINDNIPAVAEVTIVENKIEKPVKKTTKKAKAEVNNVDDTQASND